MLSSQFGWRHWVWCLLIAPFIEGVSKQLDLLVSVVEIFLFLEVMYVVGLFLPFLFKRNCKANNGE